MAKTLALTEDGDLDIDATNQLQLLEGLEAVEQELKITLATIRGEDSWHPDHGLSIFNAVGSPEPIVAREIRRALYDDDRVQSVQLQRLELDRSERSLEAEVDVELVSGDRLSFETEI